MKKSCRSNAEIKVLSYMLNISAIELVIYLKNVKFEIVGCQPLNLRASTLDERCQMLSAEVLTIAYQDTILKLQKKTKKFKSSIAKMSWKFEKLYKIETDKSVYDGSDAIC